MPVVPNNGKLLIELSSETAVAELIDVARSLDPDRVRRYGSRDSRIAADVGDHLMYLSATHPDWFAPYRDLAATSLADRLPMDVGTAAVLLPGLETKSVDHLCKRLEHNHADWQAMSLLVGAADARGLAVLADLVRTDGSREWTNRLGVHVGPSGAARLRFSPNRYAVVVPSETRPPGGPVGLPVGDVADDPDRLITWHYASIRPADIREAVAWPHEFAHIVSPRTYWYTMQCQVGADGRLTAPVVDDHGEHFETRLREIEADPPPPSTLSLHEYDAVLTYRNGHVHMTPHVVGDAGGPPNGIHSNPVCPECAVLMFHIATVGSDVREYGEGFRSVFVCESCDRTAVTGTSWN